MPTTLPASFADLAKKKAPKLLVEGIKIFGTREVAGKENNPDIMGWAEEIGFERDYTADEIPWCGLAMAAVVLHAGYEPVGQPLWAQNWNEWGTCVARNAGTVALPKLVFTAGMLASLGDVLVFSRKIAPGVYAGHVGIYVGEDATCYWVLGGNQGNAYCIVRVEKARCIGVRRSPWKIGQPNEVKPVWRKPGGLPISTNEA